MDSKKLWILVEVHRGIPDSITVFKSEQSALSHGKKMRAEMNLDYDETGLFEVDLDEVSSKKQIMIDNQIAIEAK
jgi:hypothetical protein